MARNSFLAEAIGTHVQDNDTLAVEGTTVETPPPELGALRELHARTSGVHAA